MSIRERIHELSILPSRFKIMLEQALLGVSSTSWREELCTVACVVSNATWQHWQAWRLPEDNRQEHEWVVFANVMRIAESENLTLTERRIATAFCFIHDTYFIRRIMESEIEELKNKGLFKEAEVLETMKRTQRSIHMNSGAVNTRFLLNELKQPHTLTSSLFSENEVESCIKIVANHDSWKLEPPKPFPTTDRLAVVCLEGDALWVLHPIGVLADLDRPDKDGESKNLFDPSKWFKQVRESLNNTLIKYRHKWEEKAEIPKCDFIDDESIFRTKEGHRLYSEWRNFWNL